MTNFHAITPFSMPQASQFSLPRKASFAEEDDVQPINAATEDPEEAAEIEPAAQTSKKRHAPLPQHFTPLVKPSGPNWLAYAGIGAGSTLVGGLAGLGYKGGVVPNGNIELKTGWERTHKDNRQVVHLKSLEKSTIVYSLGNDTQNIDIYTPYLGDKSNIEQVAFSRMENSDMIGYTLISEDKKSTLEGLLTKPTTSFWKFCRQDLYTPLDGNFATATYSPLEIQAGNPEQFRIAPSKEVEKWQSKLAALWDKLCMEHDNITDIHAALEEKGYTISKATYEASTDLFSLYSKALDYKSWDDVAKAAVKNDKDWCKLVPKEGMGKFVGVGALAGLTVAGAGIGLYEALKPKPKPLQPSSLNRQG